VLPGQASSGANQEFPGHTRRPGMLPKPPTTRPDLLGKTVDRGDAAEVVDARVRRLLGDPWAHSHIGIFAYKKDRVKSIMI
jgi:hypothetical protein